MVGRGGEGIGLDWVRISFLDGVRKGEGGREGDSGVSSRKEAETMMDYPNNTLMFFIYMHPSNFVATI